jgi:glycosyltransferase involved in cell wall biosynthesis
VEENRVSIDLVAEMLLKNLRAHHEPAVAAVPVCPPLVRRFELLPRIGVGRTALNADRLLNRFWDYPNHLRRRIREFDLFHLVDHSYGQVVRELPSERTVLTCHDLDTFRCILEPERDPRPRWFQAMARRQLAGLQAAARVVCVSHTIKAELLGHRLVPPGRVSVAHNGVDPACSPAPDRLADSKAARLLGPPDGGSVDLLHVGSTVPRKRIDVLLGVFAEVRKEMPELRLVRVGGAFSPPQERLLERLGLTDSMIVLPFLDRDVLAAVYRRCALALQTSDAEGFGLPVAEAMACGTPVVASDLPVLMEVGGPAATYCPVGDVQRWSQVVLELLAERRDYPERWSARREASASRGAGFSWEEYTRRMVAVYEDVMRS